MVLGLLLSCTTSILPESCIKGDCKNGYGTFVLTDLEYTGEFKNGKKNGHGTLTYKKDGSKYVGEWKNGNRVWKWNFNI